MLISRVTAEKLHQEYMAGKSFIGVAHEISEVPVYANVKDGQVQWFSYDRPTEYEWANVALLEPEKLEYNHTHFYVQLEKYLPTRAIAIERLEIDTPEDLHYAERVIHSSLEYNFWQKGRL